ncbi:MULTISPECIES: DUF1517 domain-containing protein [Cyanophyceae]|uniref:DUF1517 domain-containing protein n=1 Tax=Leptolyngbya subtilissima DQ-A4 TaxID=2933933 RepID=A0ABV0JZV8_9CYAN|nr:DUF1517 domain-containing protein [Nodosilinea sp. FACHB-141]MBD2112627.1 DUF1517 domain-containing protein [Nodosilinea sp. FACHB-141]
MVKQLFQRLKPFLKPLMAVVLAVVLVFGTAQGAWAAAGGRMGGGSFRAPAPRMSPAPRTYAPGGGGGYYPGGGFGFPFLFPFIGIGGGFGGLFTLLIFIAIANVVVRGLRGATAGDDYDYAAPASSNPPVSIAKLQVGLLADARALQDDLNRLATTADTGTSQGLAKLLQETTLALLRHPDYWAYAAGEEKQTRLLSAEQEFNRYTLSARSQFSAETLSNVNNQLTQAEPQALLTGDTDQAPGEYILATVVVATQGKLDLPKVYSSADLRQALNQIGAVSGENLLAVEVLWTPQQSGETLSGDELIAQYPELKLI